MIRLFEGVTGGNIEGVRTSLGLGIDSNTNVMIIAEGVNVQIAGQKNDDVDVKLTGLAEVVYDLTNDGEGELLIKAKANAAADTTPVIRVYLPINVGTEELTVMTYNSDITVDSVVKRAFIEHAELTAMSGDIVMSGNSIIEEANVVAVHEGNVTVDYGRIQSDITMTIVADDITVTESVCDEDDADEDTIEVVSPTGYDVIIEKHIIGW